jgi:T5SS/PEP-CTERM-associated repeat protein/autotransporter-associated beta strand protein
MYVGFAAGSNGSVTVRGGLLDASAASGGGSLYVGNNGTGRLDLEAGRVRSDFATIGSGNGSQGTALITGGTWTNTQTAFIGSGTGSRGSLTVDGGTVESVWTFVADSAGSIGQVALRSGSFDAGSYLYVGNNGSGSMSISGGAGEAGWAWLGIWAGSSGSMNLTGGTFQTWGGMEVGYQGTGSLTIDGGRLTNWGDTTVGSAAGGFGTVTVTSGTLGNWGSMTIGAVGSGSLSVSGSGVVHIDDALHVGPNGAVSIGPGGTIDLGWSYEISGDPPVGTLSDGSVTGNIANDGRLVFNRGASVTFAGVISGTGEVVKAGTAPLTFSGAHTFTGTYEVTAGTLSIDGSTAAGSRLVVANGATLAGTGLVGSMTTVDGTLAPGHSPGVLTFADDLTFASGSGIEWELAANDTATGPLFLFDRIVVDGDLTFAGSNVLSLVFAASGSSVDWGDAFWNGEARWRVFDVADGRSTVGFGGLSIAPFDWLDANGTRFTAARRGSFSLALDGNDVLLVYTPVPEPATATLALVGLGIMYLDRHRRRMRRRPVEMPPA